MENVLLTSLVGTIIFFVLLYFVIDAAVKPKTRKKYQEIQIKLLMEIAKKNGVEQSVIDSAVK